MGAPLSRENLDRSTACTAGDGGEWCRLVGLEPLEVDAAGRELLEAVCRRAASGADMHGACIEAAQRTSVP